MIATHKVKDKDTTLGYIIDGEFYNNYRVYVDIDLINNLIRIGNSVVETKQLPVVGYDTISKSRYTKLVEKEPFERDIQDSLSEWGWCGGILQLEGARGVGKTTEVLKYGYSRYSYVIYINHMVNPILIERESIRNHCIRSNIPGLTNDRSTLLILDEIQDSPMTTIGIDDNIKCDIIAISSTLGCAKLHTHKKDIDYIKMTPLSFSEVSKLGVDKDTYKQIGGYPAVIREFLAKKNINSCYSILDSLYNSYVSEIRARTFDEAMDLDSTVYGATSIIKNIYAEIARQRGDKQNVISQIHNILERTVTKEQISDVIELMISNNKLYEHNNNLYYTDCGIANYIAYIMHIVNSIN